MKDTVLIYSGGLDSTSALYIYKNRISLAISFNYGSRHNKQEIKRAKLNCDILNIEHKVINMQEAFKDIDSALMDTSKPIPEGHYESTGMKDTVVPFRNGIMLSVATGIADSRGLTNVMLGSHSGDHAVYPDCTPTFNAGISAAMRNGTNNKVNLLTPFMDIDKKEVCKLGLKVGVNPELTYSCYKGGEKQCGVCSTCVERRWALGELSDEEVEGMKDEN